MSLFGRLTKFMCGCTAPKRWYRHDYSAEELGDVAERIKASGAKRAWIYFNNDYDAHAPGMREVMHRLLKGQLKSGRGE